MLEVRRVVDAEREGVVDLLQQYLTAIGEKQLDGRGIMRVAEAIAADRIRFFAARRDGRTVGICSVTFSWSTFGGGAPVGTLEDLFVEPGHRRMGVARALVERVYAEVESQGCRSVVVGCSKSDVPRYAAMGFSAELGVLLAHVIPLGPRPVPPD